MMEDNKYDFLFPYEKIPAGSKILIYGAGRMGRDYLQQILVTQYCEVIGFVDRSYNKYPKMVVPAYSPSQIQSLDFDYIVVAMKNEEAAMAVIKNIGEMGIQRSNIIFVGYRKSKSSIYKDNDVYQCNYDDKIKGGISIAILLCGGYGDCIVYKRFIEEIIKYVPECTIDFYYSRGSVGGAKEGLSYLYWDCPQVDRLIDDTGSAYENNVKKYAMGISFGSLPRLDWCDDSRFPRQYDSFLEKMKAIASCYESNIENFMHPDFVLLLWELYHGRDEYSAMGLNGLFSINDKTVHISPNPKFKESFENLGLTKYITLNYGNGHSEDKWMSVAKQWPIEYFNKFVDLFKKQFPKVEVVQLGMKTADHVSGVDKYILGEPMELVVHVLSHSILHLDIDGGLMHLASQLGTMCVILWGPTNVNWLGYKKNINILPNSNICQGCHGIGRAFECIRGLEKPECMYSIKPERVIEEVNRYLLNTGENL